MGSGKKSLALRPGCETFFKLFFVCMHVVYLPFYCASIPLHSYLYLLFYCISLCFDLLILGSVSRFHRHFSSSYPHANGGLSFLLSYDVFAYFFFFLFFLFYVSTVCLMHCFMHLYLPLPPRSISVDIFSDSSTLVLPHPQPRLVFFFFPPAS